MSVPDVWREKSDAEIREAANNLADYTKRAQELILFELRKRGLAEPPPRGRTPSQRTAHDPQGDRRSRPRRGKTSDEPVPQIVRHAVELPLLFALSFGMFFGFVGFLCGLAGLIYPPLVNAAGAGLVGVVVGLWVGYRQHRQPTRLAELPRFFSHSFGFGAVFGFVGFMCGLVGPIYLNPSSNLAPIIGFIVTGPGGFLVGVVVGLWAAYRRLSFEASFRALAIGSLLVALASLALSLP